MFENVTFTPTAKMLTARSTTEFIFKGFDNLGYLDHVDYTIIQSTNQLFNKAVVRVNVHRQHRQTIQCR